MSNKILGVYFLFIFLLVPAVCFSSEDSKLSAMEETKKAVFAQSKEAVEDLLMFWEEKDLFVQTATRNEKSISQVAENMTVITAKDIEDMNAHTVAEVLNRVTGVFVDPQGGDFGSSALVFIQSSEHKTDMSRHTLVLLDGIVWNTGGSNAVVNVIPLGIIKRIEIIKGPASSAWGSSLGGVINIITKDAGNTKRPSGVLSASYGEASSQDYNAGISGKTGGLGYYLFAGRQSSDGLGGINRDFDKDSLYSKFNVQASKDINLGFSVGYNEANWNGGDYILNDFNSRLLVRDFFTTASLDVALTDKLRLNLLLYFFEEKFNRDDRVLGLGNYDLSPYYVEVAGDNFSEMTFINKTRGGNAKLIWTQGNHTVILGADISHGTLDSTLESGPYFQTVGVPAEIKGSPDIDKWAVFVNDTIKLGKFSITPGIRYDHNSITGSFTSPSLGLTYKAAEKTILRASVARGFTIPPLGWTSVGNIWLDPNPDLEPEKVWSFQAGLESNLTNYVWLKATVFYHDLEDAIVKEYFAGGPPGCEGMGCNDLYINKDNIKRKGFEVEADTVSFHNFSLKTGFAYVRTESGHHEATDAYSYNVSLKYDDRKSLMAQFFGYYTWWDLEKSSLAKYDAMLWDFNLRKKIYSTETADTELFFAVHNIFNGSYYTFADTKNPNRWVEAGLRVRF